MTTGPFITEFGLEKWFFVTERAERPYWCFDFLVLNNLESSVGRQLTPDWIRGCEQLAAYYTTNNEVIIAHHFIICASSALQKCRSGLQGTEQLGDQARARIAELEADIALTWAKLYSKRLQLSAHPNDAAPQSKTIPEEFRYLNATLKLPCICLYTMMIHSHSCVFDGYLVLRCLPSRLEIINTSSLQESLPKCNSISVYLSSACFCHHV